MRTWMIRMRVSTRRWALAVPGGKRTGDGARSARGWSTAATSRRGRVRRGAARSHSQLKLRLVDQRHQFPWTGQLALVQQVSRSGIQRQSITWSVSCRQGSRPLDERGLSARIGQGRISRSEPLEVRVLTTSARKPPLRTDKFAALWRIAAPVHPIRRSNCAESGYCELIRPEKASRATTKRVNGPKLRGQNGKSAISALKTLLVLSRKLFENVNSLFANESDGYKSTSAPSAFRFSCGRSARTGQESTPEQSECHYRNRHQEDLSHRCRGRHRGSPASVLQSQDQETSSAADPATVFDRVNRFPSHPQIISDRLSPFANNVLPFALNLRGAAHIRK
jgi:hypothetical protein